MNAKGGFDETDTALLDARTRALARAPDEDPSAVVRHIEVVLLRTAGESYALSTRSVQYVAELTRLTPVPHAPAVVAGLTALRGEVLAVFALRPVLGLELSALPEHARVVLVGHGNNRVALAVDAVLGPLPLALDDLSPPMTGPGPTGQTLIRGIDPTGIALLDADALLADERLFIDIPLSKVEDSMTTRTRR
jgi:purine-binding chemotaxis protein CheW